MPHTLAQKILQAHTDEEVREAGQIVNCHLSGVLANDITGPLAIKSFRAMGAAKVFDKDRVFLVMDHFTPQKDIDSANQVMVTRQGSRRKWALPTIMKAVTVASSTPPADMGLVKPAIS